MVLTQFLIYEGDVTSARYQDSHPPYARRSGPTHELFSFRKVIFYFEQKKIIFL